MEKVEGIGLELQEANQQGTTPIVSTTYHHPSKTEDWACEWLRLDWGLPEGTRFKTTGWSNGVHRVVAVVPGDIENLSVTLNLTI